MQDNFDGDRIDRNLWTAGYSHTNQDTRIYQEDGLHIDIKQGGEYSGAAAVTCDCYHGDFDAQVDFHVAFPIREPPLKWPPSASIRATSTSATTT
ncbi:hypothetical protein [Aliamphritea spongicola]|nr:hypothetical protein [Aliamphritea spongicola]